MYELLLNIEHSTHNANIGLKGQEAEVESGMLCVCVCVANAEITKLGSENAWQVLCVCINSSH